MDNSKTINTMDMVLCNPSIILFILEIGLKEFLVREKLLILVGKNIMDKSYIINSDMEKEYN